MKRSPLVYALVAFLIVQFSCLPTTATSLPPGNSMSPSPIPPIGSIVKIQGAVQAGPESALANVDPTRAIKENDAVHVFDSGKANLDFGYGIVFTLYNDTKVEGTKVDNSGTSQQVKSKLSQGGLKGENPVGSRSEVDIPNGGKIIILGTKYFIAYDSQRDITWVYNYDGRVQYSFPGIELTELPAKALLDFNPATGINILYDQKFSTDDFDQYATQFNSPIQGLEAMQKEFAATGITRAEPTVTPAPRPTAKSSLPSTQQIQNPYQTTGSRVAFNSGDKFVFTIDNRVFVINQDGDVFAHDVEGNFIGDPYQLTGSRVAFNSGDKFVFTLGNRIYVINQDGDVFAHDVSDNVIGDPIQTTGSRVAFNSGDKFVFTLGNRIFVINQDGDVFAHGVDGNFIGDPYQITGSRVAFNSGDKFVFTIGNRIFVIDHDGNVVAYDTIFN